MALAKNQTMRLWALVLTLIITLTNASAPSFALAPTAPVISSVSAGNGYAQVVFTGSANSPTNYKYQLSTDDGVTFSAETALSPADNLSPIYIPGLVNGTSYYIKLIGTNADGDSPASAASSKFVVKPLSTMRSSQAFLMGQYAEVGVRANGAFGSSGVVPTGFHDYYSGCLGFRVDRSEDGWGTTGTIDDGDFFCPGSAYEGWQLKVDAEAALNNCHSATAITGALSEISLSDGQQSVQWNSAAVTNGISVKQVAVVPDTSQVLHVDITLTNTSVATVNSIYYGRSFDPDNATGPDVYNSSNTVESVSSPAKVTSTWTNGSFISLYSADSRAKAAKRGSSFGCDENPSDIYSAPSTGNLNDWTSSLDTNLADAGTGIAVKIDSLAANASTTFRISYVLTDNAANLPGAPTISSVVPGDGFLDVNFTQGANVATNIEYSTNGGTDWLTRTPVSAASPLRIGGLTNGTTYPVVIRAVNTYGTGPNSSSVSATPLGLPGAPTITSIGSGIKSLSVNYLPGANGGSPITNFSYALSSDNGANWGSFTPLAAASSANPVVIPGLLDGQAYLVKLKAINVVGAGAESNAVSAATSSAPGAPVISSIHRSDSKLYVYFSLGTTGGSEISNIEYSTDDGATWVTRTSSSTLSPLLISGLTNGTTYQTKVRAINGVGAGIESSAVAGTPATVPGAPTYTGSPTTASSEISITISAPTNGGSVITNYEYSTDRGSTWRPRSGAASAATALTIQFLSVDGTTALVNGTEYCVQIRAVNSVGTGDASADTCATPKTSPGAPTISALVALNKGIKVDFLSGSNGGSPITSVEYSIDGGTSWTAASDLSGSFVIGGLTNGDSYSVQIRAVNVVGTSIGSNILTSIPVGPPSAPVISTITPSSEKLNIEYTLGSNNGSTVTTVEYSLDAGATWVTPSPTSFSSPLLIVGLTNDTTYRVQLRAVNAIGVGTPTASAIASTPRLIAESPVISSVTAGNATLSVAFVAGLDNGSALTNYEYSTDGGVLWITRTPASTASPIAIQGLTNGTPYTVRLRAVNATGVGAQSASTAGTPYMAPGAPVISSVVNGNASLTVNFTAGTANGSPISNYQYSTDGGGVWVSMSPESNTSPITINGLTNSNVYNVKIRAVNAAGSGLASNTVQGTPDGTIADIVSPVFASGRVTTSGTSLELTYNELLSTSAPIASQFVVLAGGAAVVVSSVSVSSTKVTLTLSSVIYSGVTVTVSYTDSTAGNDAVAIQDVALNDAVSFTTRSVTNNSTQDGTSPVLVSGSASASGTRITLTFNEALSSTTAAIGTLTISAGSRVVTLLSVTISGLTAIVELDDKVFVGDVLVVSYVDPTNANDANAIQDVVGNDCQSFSAASVINNSTQDGTSPLYVSGSASASGTRITLTFNEALSSNTAAIGTLTISAGSRVVTLLSVTISGLTVVVDLDDKVFVGDVITLSYLDPTNANDANAIQDVVGNDCQSFSAASVTNNSTQIRPSYYSGPTTTPPAVTVPIVKNVASLLDAKKTLVTGLNFKKIIKVVIGALSTKVTSSSETALEVVTPDLAAGTYDLYIYFDDGTVLKSAAVVTIAGNITPTTTVKKFVVKGFKKGITTLPKGAKAQIARYLKANKFKSLECVGSTEGPTILRADTRLAMQRAKAVCAVAKKLGYKVISSSYVNQFKVGSAYRSAAIVLKK